MLFFVIKLEQRREAPKPIVWEPNTTTTTTTTTSATTFSTQPSNQSNFRIRRTPVAQTQNIFASAQQAQSQPSLSQSANQLNYFQDNVIQPTYRLQNTQFQLQNQFGQNQANQTALMNPQQRTLIRNPRAQTMQTQSNQPIGQQTLQNVATGQQPIRLMNRGGGIVGGQPRRSGGPGNQASNQTGLGSNPNQTNPAQRGGRNNF